MTQDLAPNPYRRLACLRAVGSAEAAGRHERAPDGRRSAINGSEPLSERVRRNYASLSEGQRRIARFCVNEPARAASLTAQRIGSELGLSESTVVRFAVALGYEGFPSMQAELREAVAEIEGYLTRIGGG